MSIYIIQPGGGAGTQISGAVPPHLHTEYGNNLNLSGTTLALRNGTTPLNSISLNDAGFLTQNSGDLRYQLSGDYVINSQLSSYQLSGNYAIASQLSAYQPSGDYITNSQLSAYVPKTTTVNGHQLSGNITITKSDVGLGNVPNVDTTNPANINQTSSLQFVTYDERNDRIKHSTDVLDGTRIISGGVVTQNGSTAIDIASGVGNIYDSTTQTNSTVTWDTTTNFSLYNNIIAGHDASYIVVDKNGTISALTTDLFDGNLRNYIYLCKVAHRSGSVITNVRNFKFYGEEPVIEINELTKTIGNIVVSGNIISAASTNLSIKKSIGTTYRFHANADQDRKNPNIVTDAAINPITFVYCQQKSGGGVLYTTGKTAIVPGKYDVGGSTLADVNTNEYTVQRVYHFPRTNSVYVFYGQEIYYSMADAYAGIVDESFTLDTDFFDGASLRAFIIVKGDATNLADTNQAVFYSPGRLQNFGEGSNFDISSLKATSAPGIDTTTPVTVSLDYSTRVLTVSPTNGHFNVFIDGGGITRKFTKTGPVQFPAFTDTMGMWYFYFDNNGDSAVSQTEWADIANIATIYRLVWNTTLSGSAKAVGEFVEYHNNSINMRTRKWFHAYGAVHKTGLDVVANSTTGTPNADGRNTCIGLTTGTFIYDGTEFTITNGTGGAEWEQDLGPATAGTLTYSNAAMIPVLHRVTGGGSATVDVATRFPFKWNSSTNTIQYYDELGGANDLANGDYAVYFIWALPDKRTGTAIRSTSYITKFTSIDSARAIDFSNLVATFPNHADKAERPLYKLIYQMKNGYSSAVKMASLVEITDIRVQKISVSSAVTGNIPATSVTLQASGNISSTNVQSAIQELDTEKANDLAFTANSGLLKVSALGTPIGTGVTVASMPNQNGGNALKFWSGTLANYNAIGTKDPDTLYFIF